jgi:(1->4)-alpha-D-glucan 1-alpha-D-glucosylmutase
MQIPVSTYRLQLNASFTFNDVENILSWLQELGISTIYASPFFTATPGSVHGYDVADPHTLNPEIGTMDQLLHLRRQMQQNNMTWLQDVVPNHMVFSMNNQRLADVLERGPFSFYYNWFDINWQHHDPALHGRLMVPVLAKPLSECIKEGSISLDFTNDGFVVNYSGLTFPLSISAYNDVLAVLPAEPAAKAVTTLLKALYDQATTDKPLIKWKQFKQPLINVFLSKNAHVTFIKQLVQNINSNLKLLQEILDRQYYRLNSWQDANRVINYRRFFAVNELISLNMHEEPVFYEYHNLLYNLYEQKIIHGLRIDHIDGLSDPGRYMNRLRRLFGNDCYMIVEKILDRHEQLPAHWQLQGTTGYEFCAQISWLLTNIEGAKKLTAFYKELFPHLPDYKEIVFEKKKMFLQAFMGGEWDNLVANLYTLNLVSAAIDRNKLKQALGLFMCCLPVYRLYPNDQPPETTSQQIIQSTFKDALQRQPELSEELTFLQSLWNVQGDNADKRLAFQQRLMQFTGPLTAKGVEDTTFYVYNALLAHNEVGDSPEVMDFSVKQFHENMVLRQQKYPHSLNATSTHDTKRGEDGRIRLLALTWFTNDWKQHVQHWQQLNEIHKSTVNGHPAPDLQDEYFLYQSILAGFPSDGQVTTEYIGRLQGYFIKSVREAKINSEWQMPNKEYEEAGCGFIEKILSVQHGFLRNFRPFFKAVQEYAAVFSLTQVLLKITAPGIPDIYQGSELWNIRYVDPDNRRPVDYAIPKKYLQQLVTLQNIDPAAVLAFVSGKKQEGLEKLFVTWKALQCRKQFSELFTHGAYYPLYTSKQAGIIAFARQYKKEWALILAPVSDTMMIPKEMKLLKGIFLALPDGAPETWTNAFTGETISAQNNLPLDALFNAFPVALLTGETK